MVGSPYARLLYGAVSPATQLEDVLFLTKDIVDNYVDDATRWLPSLDLPLNAAEISQLPPGEQGSRLGEKACELLSGDGGGWVMRIRDEPSGHRGLRDRALGCRGTCRVGLRPDPTPPCVPQRADTMGPEFAVQRFTLAHELCHLLLDREYGGELTIASGPWAPLGIEQRANAFAAAFLMPTWLLRDALTSDTARADDPDTIRSVSAQLHAGARP